MLFRSPDKDTTFEEYTTIELLSVSMLIVISTFALDFIHSDRSIFKIVDLDEAWAFLNVAQGETLSNKLVRAGRAMQAGVYFVTRSAYDVSKESLKNNIGLKFAFRSTDINEIKQTLEFFGIDKDAANNHRSSSRINFTKATRSKRLDSFYYVLNLNSISIQSAKLIFIISKQINSSNCINF